MGNYCTFKQFKYHSGNKFRNYNKKQDINYRNK